MSTIYKETYRGKDLEDIVKDWALDRPFDDYTHDGVVVDKYKEDIASVARRLELLEDAMRKDRASRVIVDAFPDSCVSRHMSTDAPTDPFAYPHVEEVHWSRPQVEALVGKMSELYCKYANGMAIDQFVATFEYLMIYSCTSSVWNTVIKKVIQRYAEGPGLKELCGRMRADMDKALHDCFFNPAANACKEIREKSGEI